MTQGRPAWQAQSGYTPPGGAGSGGGQAYAAPGSYSGQEQGYPAQDQAYAAGPDYQGYQQQGYQGYGAQQGQGQVPPPQWQAVPGTKQAGGRARPHGDKGMLASLFDFSFTSMVTPKLIKALYILYTAWIALVAIGLLIYFDAFGGLSGLLVALIIVDPLFILLSLGIYRIVLEAFMVIFQIHGELKTIREQGENRS